ncbi:hypothetical protein CBOM_04129 [Ceraceosorus bombacis]|uniref:BTB domain-containing protein n=1 Tax=Ceraceosorus bombacis TaxID=401625 RepID=A0A0P1BN15_9BASI|nr:hypothetical protein CBOM_04129 [Ceraceosorus bombacis]
MARAESAARKNKVKRSHAGSGTESDGNDASASESEDLRHSHSNSSLGMSIGRPMSRGSISSARTSFSLGRDADTASISGASVLSSASTIRAPLALGDVSPAFFEATLEYLYTAEESMVEAFEFLFEDRPALAGKAEERLEKLRQDLVFMWRSRLYSDVRIMLDDASGGGAVDAPLQVRTIPDNASAYSIAATVTDAGHGDEEGQGGEGGPTFFSTHRMMLVSRSPYFAAQLLGPYADSHTPVLRLPSPPFTPASLHFTLGFLYTGTLFFSNRTFDLATAFQLWRSGAYLQMDTLQSLISSLIAADFCHNFDCSPPCKTCTKRVPRVLAFASAPDVGDLHLRDSARRAVSGPHFGSYWFKDVGSLDYASRGALVADVCQRIEAHPPAALAALGQLVNISTRIDRERSSAWVDALRWMCESVESHICAMFEPHIATIVASEEWWALLDGVGFASDVLEKAMLLLMDGLNEKRAPMTYQIIVGSVLLREEGPPPEGTSKQLVEDARDGIVRYLRKRWINVRALSGFDVIENWALKELSHELDVPVDDLLAPKVTKAAEPARTRTGLRAASTSKKQAPEESERVGPIHMRAEAMNRAAARKSAGSAQQTSTSGAATGAVRPPRAAAASSVMSRPRGSFAPSSVSSSVRSSGSSVASASRPTPARTTSAAGSRSADVTTPSTARLAAPSQVRRAPSVASLASASSSVVESPRTPTSLAGNAVRTHTRTTNGSARNRLDSNASVLSNQSTSAAKSRTPTAPHALGAGTASNSNSLRPESAPQNTPPRPTRTSSQAMSPATSQRTPTASLRSVRSSTSLAADAAPNTPRASGRPADRHAPSAAGSSPSKATAAADVRRHTFLKATPKPAQANLAATKAGASGTSGTRQRLSSTASTASSVVSAAAGAPAKSPRKATSTASLASVAGHSGGVQRAAAVPSASRARKTSAQPGAPAAQVSRQPLTTTSGLNMTETISRPVEKSSPTSSRSLAATDLVSLALNGISLTHGIPCVVSPSVGAGNAQKRALRFRAAVKYIGPLEGRSGAWVGVEVPTPLPQGLESLSRNLNDGIFSGKQYFELGQRPLHAETQPAVVLPAREARQLRIAQIVGERHAQRLGENVPPQARIASGVKSGTLSKEPVSAQPGNTAGLFLRPAEVLWVVT